MDVLGNYTSGEKPLPIRKLDTQVHYTLDSISPYPHQETSDTRPSPARNPIRFLSSTPVPTPGRRSSYWCHAGNAWQAWCRKAGIGFRWYPLPRQARLEQAYLRQSSDHLRKQILLPRSISVPRLPDPSALHQQKRISQPPMPETVRKKNIT